MVDAFLANRHKFPGRDPSNVKNFEDKRTPVQKMSDVINTCNQKISPELVPEWERLCGRSIVEPCYYKSGLNFGEKLLQKAQKEFKLKNGDIDIDPYVTMPQSLKNKPQTHSPLCNPSGDICIYLCKTDNIQLQLKELIADINSLYDKLDCVTLCKYIINETLNSMKYREMGGYQKTLLKFKKIIKRGLSLNLSFKKKLVKICKKVFNLEKIELQDSTPRNVFISDVMKTELPFAKGVLLPKHHKDKKQVINLPIKKLLLDTGSDSNIISLEEIKNLGFTEKDLKPCGRFTLNGSTGQVNDCFLGLVSINLHLQGKNNEFYSSTVQFYVCSPDLNLSQIILGEPFLRATETKIAYVNGCISVKSTLYNNQNKSKRVKLQLFSASGQAKLVNVNSIKAGQDYGVFSLQIENNYDFYSQCKIQSENILFPLLDFSLQ